MHALLTSISDVRHLSASQRDQLRAEAVRLAERLARLGAIKVVLFGSLVCGRVSLFSWRHALQQSEVLYDRSAA
ncbi:MAG: hypothetical protein ACFLMY_19105 [Candidatus Brachytrichaceae bacterium NZ_4S206]|jgi:hypothetical protein